MDPKTGNGGNGNTSSDEYSDSPSDIDSSDGEATGSTSSSPPSSSSSSPSLRQSGTGRKPLYSSKLRNVTNFDDLGSPASTTGPSPQTASAPPRPENDSDNEDHERSRYASQLPSRGSTYLDGAPIAPVAMAEMAAQRLTNFELEPDRAPDSFMNLEIYSFVTRPIPSGQKLECKVIRRKEGMEKLYPQYELYIEDENEAKVFILAARKRKKSHTSNYIISTSRIKSTKSKEQIVGKVRSNFIGTAFTIYDDGNNPFKSKEHSTKPIREELGAVLYEPNILGLKGPRKMTVLLPGMNKEGKRPPFRPTEDKDTLLERHKNPYDKQILTLHNKTPQWNDDTQSFVLNFNSRVTQASVKNFQIVHDNDLDYIIMQFGRVSDDTFTLDFQYPLSAVQAFAIALSSFDAKLACE